MQLSHGADYDRVVFEFNSAVGHPGAAISVVAPNSFTGFGGTPLTLAGVSAVAINFTGATHYQYYDARGNGRLTGGTTNVAEVVNTISLNDTGSWGIAMKEKAGYKATWLENPTRLVVDVQSAPDSGVPEFLTWNAVPFSEGGTPAAVASTRSGAHLDYDRVVLDYADGPIGSINVACGYNAAGVPIVKVTARVAAATPLVAPQVATWWSVVLRDVTATRDGTTPDLVTYSLVLDGTRPQFRIFTLSGANRLVIDVRPGA